VTRSVMREELDFPRRQCTLSLSSTHSWVSCQPQHVITSATTLLVRFSSCRLLPLPEDEDAAERSLRSSMNRKRLWTHTKWLRGCIPAMAGMLWPVHCCARWLFRMRWCSDLGK
jgi:hypothetical protein